MMEYVDDEYSKFMLLYGDDDIECVMEIAPRFMDGVFVHTHVKAFSLSSYKKYKTLWPEVVKYMKAQGVNNIYACPTDAKAEKWEKSFGFVDTGVFFEGQKIMEYEG